MEHKTEWSIKQLHATFKPQAPPIPQIKEKYYLHISHFPFEGGKSQQQLTMGVIKQISDFFTFFVHLPTDFKRKILY